MEDKHDTTHTGSKQPGHESNDDLEERLAKTLSSLRLFVDRTKPLSVKSAMTRAQVELDNYLRWKDSGTPINGIVVQLADGEEMHITKRSSRMLAATCSATDLLPGAVLNIYKKADKYFDQVLLYSIEVSEIPPEGFTFEKNYPTKQSLFLQVQRGAEGRLNVSVDYTPLEAIARRTYSDWIRRIPILGSALLALASLLYVVGRKLRRDELGVAEPSWTAVSAVVTSVALLGIASLYWSRPEPRKPEPLTPRMSSVGPATTPLLQTSRPEEGAPSVLSTTFPPSATAPKTSTVGDVNKDGIRNAIPAQASKGGGEACNASFTPEKVDIKGNENAVNENVAVKPAGVDKAMKNRRDPKTQQAASFASHRIEIYVKAYAKDDKKLETKLLHSVVEALEKTDKFIVWTDERDTEVPKGIYEVSLYFDLVDGCYGNILARLYDLRSKEIGVWNKDCHEYRREEMLRAASDEIVKKVVPRVFTDVTAQKKDGS